MKKCCNDIDITDPLLIERACWKALKGKYGRNNYVSLLASYGVHSKSYLKKFFRYCKYGVMTYEERNQLIKEDMRLLVNDIANRIKNRNLDLEPVRYEERFDHGTGKLRRLGIESPMHQMIEHVLCLALSELWQRKICPHQYSSLDGKGQKRGVKCISRWCKKKDFRYFVKGDIRKCFNNIRHEDLMRLFEHDIKNKDLLWLIKADLKMHEDEGSAIGIIIGSWFSSLACNYLLSFAYRYVESLYKMRRDKRIKLVTHTLFFMDDILLCGTSRNDLRKAVRLLNAWLENEYCLSIKANWHIKDINKEPITMMGYTIYATGKIKIRRKTFKKVRRAFIAVDNDVFSLKQARRCTSYFGFPVTADVKSVWKLPNGRALNIALIKQKAADYQSGYERKQRDYHYVKYCRECFPA